MSSIFSVTASFTSSAFSPSPLKTPPKPKAPNESPAGNKEEIQLFWPERRFVNPDSSRLLSAAYLPIVPKVASDVSPKRDCADDSLIPAKLDT